MNSAHVFNGQFVKKNNTGPGPAPGRPAQRLDTATDHLTSTLATWAATCVQVIRARARGSPGPLQPPPDAAAPQPPGNGVALTP